MARSPVTETKTRSARFAPPPDLDVLHTPPERPRIPNTNVPLTLGLLFSIVAAFIVFFASVAGGNAGRDPIMASFWRGLAALAVFSTLSFVGSWFMPPPSDRRGLLEKLEAEESLWGDGTDQDAAAGETAPDESPAAETGRPRGGNVDVTLADELDEALAEDDVDDDFALEDEEGDEDDAGNGGDAEEAGEPMVTTGGRSQPTMAESRRNRGRM
ncbi:MAG: hypothetical protein ACYDAG_14260 [Chloroflexota bacterium]